MKFSAFNVDFSNLSLDRPGSRRPAGVRGFSLLKWLFLSAAGLPNMKMVPDRHRRPA